MKYSNEIDMSVACTMQNSTVIWNSFKLMQNCVFILRLECIGSVILAISRIM